MILVLEPEWASGYKHPDDVKKPHERSAWDDAKDAKDDLEDVTGDDAFQEFPDGPDDVQERDAKDKLDY